MPFSRLSVFGSSHSLFIFVEGGKKAVHACLPAARPAYHSRGWLWMNEVQSRVMDAGTQLNCLFNPVNRFVNLLLVAVPHVLKRNGTVLGGPSEAEGIDW